MQYRLDAPLDELLDMARQRFDVAFEPVNVGDIRVEVLQVQNMKDYLDRLVPTIHEDALTALPLWAKIWPSAIVLGHALRRISSHGKSLLEIGAGCGVTGLLAAGMGFAEVTISDINEDALLFAQIAALHNGLGDVVRVRRVDIASTRLDTAFDYIAGAEVLYLEPLHRPLVKFLRHHLAARPDAEALLAKDYRRKAKKFFKLAERDFRITDHVVGTRETNAPAPSVSDTVPPANPATAGAEAPARALFTIHSLRVK